MAEADYWYLLVQFRREGRTQVKRFTNLQNAAAAYSDMERAYAAELQGVDPEMDVLLVGASNLDVIKDRYPSYFTKGKSKADKVSRLLAALPAALAH
ncbi:MAG: hypothetical protein GEU86_14580 [Actinophytocola sp.]|nr:hypothetical protein [Actinophytocola sp.]